jgi:hypothetical protein
MNERYVMDIFSTDHIAETHDGDIIVIDRLLPFDDSVIIDGYYEESGDDFMKEFSLDDVVWVRYPANIRN